jgi:hypothetical protein
MRCRFQYQHFLSVLQKKKMDVDSGNRGGGRGGRGGRGRGGRGGRGGNRGGGGGSNSSGSWGHDGFNQQQQGIFYNISIIFA